MLEFVIRLIIDLDYIESNYIQSRIFHVYR